MLKIFIRITLLIFLASNIYAQNIRIPSAAGKFYPDDKKTLNSTLNKFLDRSETRKVSGDINALIIPHAGIEYSGQVAAEAYKYVSNRKYDAVVIIAPSHFESFPKVSIFPGNGLKTPLGTVNIHKELAESIKRSCEIVSFSNQGYYNEHALEIQLPFIQTVLPGTPVVPLVMGYQNFGYSFYLGKSLAAALKGRNILFVASTDLSHFHEYEEAKQLDKNIADLISGYDPMLLSQKIFSGEAEACGGGPLIAVMTAAQLLGSNHAEVIRYANSGDITNEKRSVVGYLSAVITNSGNNNTKLSLYDRNIILDTAISTVNSVVRVQDLPKLPGVQGALSKNSGVFVTLKINGQLRGCIGRIFATEPLINAVQWSAKSAAVKDERFFAVNEFELPLLEYEVSILSPMKLINDTEMIEIGRHGLFLVNGTRSGLLLPQVAVQNDLNRLDFLRHASLKADLPADGWEYPSTFIFVFEADVFSRKGG
ncbi:AmmeMemoRadiSam system protein B [candidate division KSB1 bacterium]